MDSIAMDYPINKEKIKKTGFMAIKGFIKIDKERCKGCGFCVEHCPKKILKIGTYFNSKGYHPAEIPSFTERDNKNGCNGCALCAIVCPDMAIEVYRE